MRRHSLSFSSVPSTGSFNSCFPNLLIGIFKASINTSSFATLQTAILNRTLTHSTPNLSTHRKCQSFSWINSGSVGQFQHSQLSSASVWKQLQPDSHSLDSPNLMRPSFLCVLLQHVEDFSSSPCASVRTCFPLLKIRAGITY